MTTNRTQISRSQVECSNHGAMSLFGININMATARKCVPATFPQLGGIELAQLCVKLWNSFNHDLVNPTILRNFNTLFAFVFDSFLVLGQPGF